MNSNEKKSVYLREERDRALFIAYSKAISSFTFASQPEAVDYARTHEAPRFYIDGEFCRVVVNRIRSGRPMGVKGESRIRKFTELYSRFQTERANPRNAGLSTLEICNIIVEQKAPEFYISSRSARMIISRQKARLWEEKARRLKR